MNTISKTRSMNVASQKVWNVLKDFGGVYKFHPVVETSPLLSQRKEGVGAKRVCHFYDKSSITEEVIDWKDGKEFTVELSEGSLPIKHAEATMRVEPVGNESSRVTIEMKYVVKFGPVGWLMNKLIITGKMQALFNSVLESLEHHAKTGESIGRNGISREIEGSAQLQAAS